MRRGEFYPSLPDRLSRRKRRFHGSQELSAARGIPAHAEGQSTESQSVAKIQHMKIILISRRSGL
jgi:hypothetical protein